MRAKSEARVGDGDESKVSWERWEDAEKNIVGLKVVSTVKIFFKVKFQCFEVYYFNGSSDNISTFLRNGSSTAGIPREGTSYTTLTVSATTKIFEQLLYWHLSSHVQKNEILNDAQHGYRRHRSTLSASFFLTQKIKEAGDNKLTTGLVFIDFRKAFDMIRHDVLIEKLSNAGIKENLLLLYKNYFRNRQFCVQNGTTESRMEFMNDGAPQGSILPGLIFILYINSITKTFKQSSTQTIWYLCSPMSPSLQ